MNIETVLARRTDLSTFLVHLTRTSEDTPAKDRLKSILTTRRLEARTPFGPAVAKLKSAGLPTTSQRCVCFTETPLEHVSLLAEEIEDRQCQFERYGIAITKKQARRLGVNPVWYLDITPGHDWLTKPIDTLIEDAVTSSVFDDKPISKVAPLVEQMGSGRDAHGNSYRKEFWWEREWRRVGNVQLPDSFLVLCPEGEIHEFEKVVSDIDVRLEVGFLDPAWSLEQIIARLAGFAPDDVGPM